MSNNLAKTIEYDKFRHLYILYEILKTYCQKLEEELKTKGEYDEKYFVDLYESSKIDLSKAVDEMKTKGGKNDLCKK